VEPAADGENNLAGYCLERQADGGEWEAVYTGPELSFTDQVTKGWQTVAYRVRAYDTENAYSGYTAGEARAVNNNTPPEITCEYPANTSLGVKTEGFSVPYSVADEEGDPVSVTEAVDGVNPGDQVSVDFDTGVITNVTKNETYQAEPFPDFIKEIIASGGLMASLKAKEART